MTAGLSQLTINRLINSEDGSNRLFIFSYYTIQLTGGLSR